MSASASSHQRALSRLHGILQDLVGHEHVSIGWVHDALIKFDQILELRKKTHGQKCSLGMAHNDLGFQGAQANTTKFSAGLLGLEACDGMDFGNPPRSRSRSFGLISNLVKF